MLAIWGERCITHPVIVRPLKKNLFSRSRVDRANYIVGCTKSKFAAIG